MEEREDSDRDKWSSGEAIPERERESSSTNALRP
jgi:hypothetical protein